MNKKIFTLLIAFTFLLGGMASAQKSLTAQTGLAKKFDEFGNKIAVTHQTYSVPNTQFSKAAILTQDFETGALPAGWSTVIGQGSIDWTYQTGGHNGNPAAAHGGTMNAHFYVGSYAGDNSSLITSALDLSSGSYRLSFWLANVSWGGDIDEIHVSYKEGAAGTWTSLLDITTANAVWTEQDIAIPSTNAEVYIRFNAVSNYGYGICVDDVSVYQAEANDLAVTAVTPEGLVLSGSTVTPQVTISNLGGADQAVWSVTLTDGTYTSTKTDVANIAAGAALVVDMDTWTPADGVHTLTATVTLTGDANLANNVLTQDVNVVLPAYTQGNLYGYDAYSSSLDQHIVDVNKTTGALTDIDLATTTDFLSCGDYIDGVVYGVEYGTNDLYMVNGDGGTYKLGTISGVTSITGIAYDATNDVVYLADYVSGSGSDLFTLNMETLVATHVGDITTNLIIGIAAGNNGELWGIDISTDHFWTINPATGAGTDVAALGIAISYAQDMGYDRAAGILYGTLYTTAGGLYTINVATGAATLVGTFTDEVSMCAIASDFVPSTSYDITFNIDMFGPNSTFNAVTQEVYLSGDVFTPAWPIPGTLPAAKMTDADADGIYTITLTLDAGDYEYKTFWRNIADAATWDNTNSYTGNLPLTVSGDATIDAEWVWASGVNNLNSGINIYPNPSNGVFTVNTTEVYNLQVLDLTGKVISTQVLNGNGSVSINNAGVYFLKFSNANNSFVQRVVVK